eukprot:11593095-Alexandrium_andersonii.AAC.1
MHRPTGATPDAPAAQPCTRRNCALVPAETPAADEHPPPAGAPTALEAPDGEERQEADVGEAGLEEEEGARAPPARHQAPRRTRQPR